ncbi:MAG: Rieske (2Fe-2S) protein, partial [Deltaproteobacteria bacterium]|nr:Rieske (2Fe-2S) protein [Deltaproteobacteria bacterium]
ENDEHITRRDCARFLLLVSGGLTIGSGLVALRARKVDEEVPPAPVDLGESSAIAPGTERPFQLGAEPALLIRRANGQLCAFELRCTHLGCPVSYERTGARESLVCHCHQGRFELERGEGIEGPPRGLRPLRRVLLSEENGRIVARGFVAPKQEV